MATVIQYGNEPLLTNHKVLYRNPTFWRGEVERNVDYIVCDRPEIVKAYQEQGVIHLDKNMNYVEQEDQGYENLPWPKLKSLASKKAGYNVLTKAEALEVMSE